MLAVRPGLQECCKKQLSRTRRRMGCSASVPGWEDQVTNGWTHLKMRRSFFLIRNVSDMEEVNLDVVDESSKLLVKLHSTKRSLRERSDAEVTITAGGQEFKYGKGNLSITGRGNGQGQANSIRRSADNQVLYNRTMKGKGVIWRNEVSASALSLIESTRQRTFMFEGEPPASLGDADTSLRAKDLQVCLSRKKQFQSSGVHEYDLWVRPEVLSRPADESGLIIALAIDGFWVYRAGHDPTFGA